MSILQPASGIGAIDRPQTATLHALFTRPPGRCRLTGSATGSRAFTKQRMAHILRGVKQPHDVRRMRQARAGGGAKTVLVQILHAAR